MHEFAGSGAAPAAAPAALVPAVPAALVPAAPAAPAALSAHVPSAASAASAASGARAGVLDPAALAALVSVPFLASLDDEALLGWQGDLSSGRRQLDAALAAVVGEIARRSDRSLGFEGLAARLGVRTPEQLVARETGVSVREAGALVRVGTAAREEGPGAVIAAAVQSGRVSLAGADEIVRGIGVTTETVDTRQLERVVTELLTDTTGRTAESLGEAARDARAELDAAAVQSKERSLRAERSLRLISQPDGMTRLIALLDPESAAQVRAVFDGITSPRRGGPRFVATSELERARRLKGDRRSTEQLALDGFVELLRIGAAVEPGEIVGTARPTVRVHVTDADLRARGIDPATGEPFVADPATGMRYPVDPATGKPYLLDPATGKPYPLDPATGKPYPLDPATGMPYLIDPVSGRPILPGFAVIEGQGTPVSIATAERMICASGVVAIHFDFSGQVVNVGRDQRLFTTRQRIGLAARDGGCIWPGCDRPPSWCEAHHIDEWRAHGGRTDLADGVLLCRFHHLYVHDRGWRITRGSGEDSAVYQAVPPASEDSSRAPIPLPSKRRLRHPAPPASPLAADTSIADTSPSDTSPSDTSPSDTSPSDTSPSDASIADTSPVGASPVGAPTDDAPPAS